MPTEKESGTSRLDALLDGADAEVWDLDAAESERQSLVELINRVLDRGVCITGEITISVAGVDLVYLGLNAVLTSISTARRSIDARIERERALGG